MKNMQQRLSHHANLVRIGALAGMFGSAFFVVVFTIEGWLRVGYNPFAMYVSELSLGSSGGIQIANFMISGVLLLVFAFGVAAEFKGGKSSKSGPILLAVIGFCLLFSGPFVMDFASTSFAQMSLHGIVHQLLGAFVFLLMPISCFVFWRRFSSDPEWQPLKSWTLAATIIIVAAVIVLRIGPAVPPAAPNAFNDWAGLIQRAALIPYMVWIFTFALAIYKKTIKIRLPKGSLNEKS